MKIRAGRAVLALASALVAALPLAAQLQIGQYENEAPFRTWNTPPFSTAAALGRGETSLTLAADASAGLANPALLVRLPRFTVTVNGFYQFASAYRFAYINTGVLSTAEPVARSLTGLDLAAAAFHFGDWAVAAAVADFEFSHRPAVRAETSSGGQVRYANDFDQTGTLRGLTFSLARRFGRWSAGATMIVFRGDFLRTSVDDWAAFGFTISDTVSRTYSGWALQGGLAWEPRDGLTLAATLRGPWTKRADGTHTLRYQAPAGPTDITITDTARDVLGQPWIAGLGFSIRPLEGLTLAAEGSYFKWSAYAPEYFGEVQERSFRDIVRIGAGAVYETAFRLFGTMVRNPNRIGLLYDPQPMTAPKSSYLYATFGTGLHWKTVHVDLGVALGWESGSGRNLAARRIALTLTYMSGDRP
jgi:hypothetical protein